MDMVWLIPMLIWFCICLLAVPAALLLTVSGICYFIDKRKEGEDNHVI